MQPQQTPTKPVMDIAPPSKPALSVNTDAATSASEPSAGIPTKTTSAMPVKEAPHDPDAPEPQPADIAEQPTDVPAPQKKPEKPQPAGQSVTGIAVATVVVMIALASLAIVVYLKS